MFAIIVNVLAQTVPQSDPDKAKMDEIDQRMRNGDKAAVLEEANLRPDVVVPSLSIAARDKSTDPERVELAREALSRVKGVEDYLKEKIDQQSTRRDADAADERYKQLDILSMVRTNKAIRIIASYLFDDKTPGYDGGDYSIGPIRLEAALLLDDMALAGAPSNKPTNLKDHVLEWRTWWLRNHGKFDDASPYRGK